MAETPLTPNSPPEVLRARTKDSYDAIASRYLQWSSAGTGHATRMKYIDRALPSSDTWSNATVLELGCGAGIPVTAALLARGMKVVANDISSTMIALAKEKLHSEKVEFIEGDMMDLIFSRNSLDAVMAFFSILHLPPSDQPIIIKRISEWLRPGGVFVANFAAGDPLSTVEDKFMGAEKGVVHFGSLGDDRTLAVIEQSGLVVSAKDTISEEADDGKAAGTHLWIIARKVNGAT